MKIDVLRTEVSQISILALYSILSYLNCDKDAIRMKRWIRFFGIITLVVVLAAKGGYLPGWPHKLNGAWLRTAGDTRQPAEVTLRQRGVLLTMKYYDGPGLASVTFRCDGVEHPWSDRSIRGTYIAELNEGSFVLTKRVEKMIPSELGVYSRPSGHMVTNERWSVSNDGRTLVASVDGKQTSFIRRSLLSFLFRPAP